VQRRRQRSQKELAVYEGTLQEADHDTNRHIHTHQQGGVKVPKGKCQGPIWSDFKEHEEETSEVEKQDVEENYDPEEVGQQKKPRAPKKEGVAEPAEVATPQQQDICAEDVFEQPAEVEDRGKAKRRKLLTGANAVDSDDEDDESPALFSCSPNARSPRKPRENVNDVSMSSTISRRGYEMCEDEKIVRYVKKNGLYVHRKGNTMWHKIEMEGVLENRSWQSMKNIFLKNIAPSRPREFVEDRMINNK
jgi:hypothetical protein